MYKGTSLELGNSGVGPTTPTTILASFFPRLPLLLFTPFPSSWKLSLGNPLYLIQSIHSSIITSTTFWWYPDRETTAVICVDLLD